MTEYRLFFPCLLCSLMIGCASYGTVKIENSIENPSSQKELAEDDKNQNLDSGKVDQTSETEDLSSKSAKDSEAVAACFEAKNVILPENFILSSVQIVELNDHKMAILAELANGNLQLILMQENGEILVEKRIASLAQIACAETWQKGFRIGIIERDPLKATYSMEVLTFDDQGAQIPDSDWHATTRGFMPDPGSKCGFLGERDMIVTGLRPRGDKPPYHGMFTLQTSSLKLFDETRIHVPEIVSVWKNGDKFRVLTREVKPAQEGGSASWPHILYRLSSDGVLEVLEEHDFIVPYDEFVPGISKDGCYLGRDEHTYCASTESEVLSVSSMRGVCGEFPEDSCMIWKLKDGHQKLVLMPAMEPPKSVEISKNLTFFSYPSMRSYKQWLAADVDALRPDVGQNLRFVEVDSKCLW